MGIFGAGNAGSAINKFLAAWPVITFGTWQIVLPYTQPLCWLPRYSFGLPAITSQTLGLQRYVEEQLALLKDPGVLRYGQYAPSSSLRRLCGTGLCGRPMPMYGTIRNYATATACFGSLLLTAGRCTACFRRLPFR